MAGYAAALSGSLLLGTFQCSEHPGACPVGYPRRRSGREGANASCGAKRLATGITLPWANDRIFGVPTDGIAFLQEWPALTLKLMVLHAVLVPTEK